MVDTLADLIEICEKAENRHAAYVNMLLALDASIEKTGTGFGQDAFKNIMYIMALVDRLVPEHRGIVERSEPR